MNDAADSDHPIDTLGLALRPDGCCRHRGPLRVAVGVEGVQLLLSAWSAPCRRAAARTDLEQ